MTSRRHPNGAGPVYLDGEMPSDAYEREMTDRRVANSRDHNESIAFVGTEPHELTNAERSEKLGVLGTLITDRVANRPEDPEAAFKHVLETEAIIRDAVTGEIELSDIEAMIKEKGGK